MMDEDFDFEDKELEEGIDNEKHWKSLSIASAVISVICIIIVIAIILLSPAPDQSPKLEVYSLEEVISKQMIKGHHFNGTWISEHEFIYQSADKNIILHNCLLGSRSAITNKLNTTNKQIIAFHMSASRTFLLVTTREPLNKHTLNTFDGEEPLEYFLYDLRNGNILNLEQELHSRNHKKKSTEKGKTNIWSKSIENTAAGAIQIAEWSPWGNELLIVVANDIYRLRMDNSPGEGIDRLTMDGSFEDAIFNGLNDQLYRDFIFGKWNSFWWSRHASRQYLCFLKANNSAVPISTVTIYPDGSSESLRHFRYPVIGGAIGYASLWVVDLTPSQAHRDAVPIKRPARVNSQHYVTYVDWTPNDELLVFWTLRNQKRTIVGLCSPSDNWHCTELTTLKNRLPLKDLHGSIVSANRRQHTSANDTETLQTTITEYLLCCQIPENGEKASHQLYSLNLKTKAITSYLNMADTLGDTLQYHKVSQLLAYNDDSDLVFFLGQSLSQINGETMVSEQDMRPNVFVLSLTFGTVQCVSCRVVTCERIKNLAHRRPTSVCMDVRNASWSSSNDNDEESCSLQSAHFGPGARFGAITCLTGIVPRVYLVQFAHLTNLDGWKEGAHLDIVQNLTLIEDNSELEQRIESKIIPNVQSFVISREYSSALKYLRLKFLTPHDFNGDYTSKYPLIFQFAPPSFEKSARRKGQEYRTEEYPDADWAIHMVTEHSYIYAWLDGHLSEDYNHSSNEDSLDQLVEDYSAVLDFVQMNMTFVDMERSCLIGGNIGASLVLITLSSVSFLRCGVALNQDTLVAEQYLDWDRFESNDLSYLLKINLNHSSLNSKNILFVHGTSNQLVPMWHTMQLMKGLTLDELKRHWRQTNGQISASNTSNTTSNRPDTNRHLIEPLINQGNSLDSLIEHVYRKVELFLFKLVN